MRTKQYLAALCLPLAFAACSDEEFVTDSPSLGSRGTINVTLNATKPGFDGVNTRIGMDGDDFVWEQNVDMLGAALADGARKGEIANDVYVNYPFTAQSSGAVSAFNSKSAIAEGNYLFYYKYEDHLGRGPLDLSLPAQKYDVAADKDAKQQAVKYMKMISPIVNLSEGVKYKDAQNYNLNLKFVNLYTMVQVKISSKNITAGATPKLKKVTLNAAGGGENGFVRTATANMEKIANKGKSPSYIVEPGADTKQIADADMNAAIEAIEALVGGAVNANPSTIYASDGLTKGAAELDIDGDLALSEAAPTELYILAPKGTYADGLVLTVETTEGVYTKEITKTPAGENLVLANQIQKMTADLDFKTNVKAPREFSIGSTDDWNNAIGFIDSHSGTYMGNLPTLKLTADVAVASLPIYPVKVTADAPKTLTFSGDFVLDKGGKMLDADNGTNVTLCVASGATLTLNDKSEFVIQNNGTLNVNANQTKKIINLGTMTVGGTVSLSAGLENGKEAVVEPDAAAAIEGTVEIPEGKSLTIETAEGLKNKVGTITVNGTLDNKYASANEGKIIVGAKGTLAGDAAITNTGTIENSGTLTLGTLTNEGGTFVIMSKSKGNGTAKINKGTVEVKDVSDFATTQGAGDKKYKFGETAEAPAVTAVATNETEYTTAVSAEGITNITLSTQEKWNIGGEGNLDVPGKNLTLKGVKVTIGAAVNGNITAEGTSEIAASKALIITGALTVNKEATLTVGKNVTFNAASQSIAGTSIAKILGNLIVKAGAKLYFAEAEVGSAEVTSAGLTVEGNITTGGNVGAGVFGVYLDGDGTKFKNWGNIISLTGESGEKINAGQISAAEAQSGEATAKGIGANAEVAFVE